MDEGDDCQVTKVLSSWVDGALEYTNLKYEILHLQLKLSNIIDKIRRISEEWPLQKTFIEKAYKVIIYSDLERSLYNANIDPQELLAKLQSCQSAQADEIEADNAEPNVQELRDEQQDQINQTEVDVGQIEEDVSNTD